MKLLSAMEYTFDNYDKSVRNYLAKVFGNLGMQYSHSQIFGLIFDGMKNIMQNVMFYIEDALTEQNIITASRKKSVYSLAKISGFEPYYGSTATGTVMVKLKVNNGTHTPSSKVYIYNNTIIENKVTGNKYIIDIPTDYYVVDVKKPLVTMEFKVIQGSYSYATYTSRGLNLETIEIENFGLFDIDYIEVTVNGEKFTRTGCLYDMTSGSKEYFVTVGYNSLFSVTFGDGVHGYKLNEGDSVIVKYLTHSGSKGNIASTSIPEFKFYQKGSDQFNNEVDLNEFLILTMNNTITGGTDADTIEFVRDMVGYNSRSNVFATEDNFKLFLKRFSFVGYTNVWSETNSMSVTVTCLSNKKDILINKEDYFDFDKEDYLITENQKEIIKETLKKSNRAFAGITLNFENPIIRRYSIIAYIKVNNTYNKEAAKTSIKNAIADYFINLPENTLFIPKSDIINVVVDNCEEVLSFDFNFVSELEEQTYKDGYYYDNELKFINGTYKYVQHKVIYEPESHPGLDRYGNIQLTNKLEIPILNKNIKYYYNKQDYDKINCISLPAIQYNFMN